MKCDGFGFRNSWRQKPLTSLPKRTTEFLRRWFRGHSAWRRRSLSPLFTRAHLSPFFADEQHRYGFLLLLLVRLLPLIIGSPPFFPFFFFVFMLLIFGLTVLLCSSAFKQQTMIRFCWEDAFRQRRPIPSNPIEALKMHSVLHRFSFLTYLNLL